MVGPSDRSGIQFGQSSPTPYVQISKIGLTGENAP